MLVRASRTASALLTRLMFYAALFLVVVIVEMGLTAALKKQGWNGGLSLLVSGAATLAIVLGGYHLGEWLRRWRAASRNRARRRQKLTDGACCVVWKPEEHDLGPEIPWDVIGHMHARYPKLARQLGVEGYAIAEFEIGAGGIAKNIHVVEAWPSDVFFDSAREALQHARFEPKGDFHVRFGASYRMPFVFRITGAAKLRDKGRRARTLRPGLEAAGQVVGKLRRGAASTR
ncbi:MAG: energy transducer TonB [Terricaulis sp.]